ncbi:unnamed protein product [Cercopithifilaria johnstoni]|uniref:Uncharacterized protein n=1 Tax=Cercopithifilaria johnstoni TaxID=2874296 RepID=A0A8J2LV13_9BILA|nr:unnamed protein product [Cercopithifilaria johnstoni]
MKKEIFACRNFSRQSLTVESAHPMHLVASGKIHQTGAESQEKLMKKFSIASEEQRDVYSAAVADKLEDQEVNNLRKERSYERENNKEK